MNLASGQSSLSEYLIAKISTLSQKGHFGLMPSKSIPTPKALVVCSLSLWVSKHTDEEPGRGRLPQWEVRLDSQAGMPGSIAVHPHLPGLGILGKPERL